MATESAQSSAQRKRRRRAERPSDALNYDREADRPGFVSAFDEEDGATLDANREVQLDELAEETPAGDEFWLEQLPPHYE